LWPLGAAGVQIPLPAPLLTFGSFLARSLYEIYLIFKK